MFHILPRSLFRFLENIYFFFSGLWHILKGNTHHDVFVSGYLFFLWIPLLKLRFHRVLVWKFGIAEEFLLRNIAKDKLKFFFIKGIEKLFLPMADTLVVQSNGMAKYLRKNFNIYQKPIYKIPCCVDYDLFRFNEIGRKKERKKLGLTGRFVVIHIGSGASWRAKNNIVKVFQAIKSKKENAFLLIVSPDPIFKELITRNQIVDSLIITLPHQEVPKTLWASDLALLINISHISTEVASPIKFPEYLAAGLPIILTGATKEYIDLINNEDLGFILNMRSNKWEYNLFEFIYSLEEKKNLIRKKAAAIVKKNLSWQCMQEVIRTAFICGNNEWHNR
ncbi:MAG: glycosyltransferase [bacterium]